MDLLQESYDALFIIGQDDVIVHGNCGRDELFDIFKDLTGKSLRDLPLKESAGILHDAIIKTRTSQKPGGVDFSLETDLSKKDIRAHLFPLSDGNVFAGFNYNHEKKPESKIHESEAIYRLLVEKASDGIGIIQDRIVMFANPALGSIVGVESSELIGKEFSSFLYGSEIERINEMHSRRISGEDVPGIYESVLTSRDGTPVNVEVNVSTIQFWERSAELIIVRDITERKTAEKELRNREEFQRLLFDTTTDIIYILNMDGNFTYVSPRFEDVSGHSADEIMGHHFTEFLNLDNVRVAEGEFKDGTQKNVTSLYNVEMHFSNGDTIPLELNVNTIVDENGEPVGRLGIARDIRERLETEKVLKDREEFQRLILSTMSDIIYTLDLEGTFVFLSPQFKTVTGHDPEELLGRHFFEFLSHGDIEKTVESFKAGITRDTPGYIAVEVVFENGDAIPFELSINTMFNEEGNPVGRLGVARDMRGRLESEKAIRESEEKYRTILDTITDGYYECDLKGCYTFFNNSFLQMSGYDADELKGMSYRELLDKDSLDDLKKKFNEIYRAGTSSPDMIIGTVLRKDGGKIYADGSAALRYNRNGDVIGFCGIVRDITERVILNEALHQSEEKYRTILDNIEDAYYEVNLKGQLTFFNDSFVRFLGRTEEELMMVSYQSFMDEETASRVRRGFNKVYKTGEPLSWFDWKIYNEDGSEKHAESSVSLMKDSRGNSIGFRGVARDITERKKIEDVLRNSEKKFRQLYKSLPGGSFVVDSDFIITDVNRLTCELTGYTYDELIGQKCSIICPEGADGCRVFENGGARIDNQEARIKNIHGEHIPVIKSAEVIPGKDGDLVLENFHNITKMKIIEEALRTSEEHLRKRNEVIEKDLETAQLIQRNLISSKVPIVEEVTIDYRYLPLDAIGGDYFSFTPLSEGGLGVFLGDVSSHGVTAALFLSLVKATTDRICRVHALQPQKYITMLNEELFDNMPLSFLTAQYGVFHSRNEDGVLFTFSSAGHPHPLLYRAERGTVETINCKGTLIGMFEDLLFEEKTIPLHKGDRIFLYTDGIPENLNEKKEIWGYERMPELIQSSHNASLSGTLDALVAKIDDFRGKEPLSDDIVIIGFEI